MAILKNMHTPLVGVLILCFSPLAFADPPTLDIPAVIKPVGQYCQITPKTDGVSVLYVGLDSVDPLPAALLKDPRLFILDTRGLPKGSYRFSAVAAGKTGEQTRADFAVLIGDVPPGPGPDPGPSPDPFVTAKDPFVKAGAPAGFRCLMVYDSNKLSTLPGDQRQVLYSDVIRAYLRSHCIVGTDKVPDWRVFPTDEDTTNDDPMWGRVMKRPRASVPWLVLGNGKAGFEGPLPLTIDDTMALLTKFGGK